MGADDSFVVRDGLFIGGEWMSSTATDRIDVVSAATELPVGVIAAGTAEDVDQAVAAATAAFPTWSATPPSRRAALLGALADGLAAREDELAQTITREIGTPLGQCAGSQVRGAVQQFRDAADVLRDYAFDAPLGDAVVTREPVGVVAAITPWNFPLSQIAYKVAPALAAGCTLVVKPSEVAPLSAFVLAEVAAQVGLPPGALNLVSGYGPVVGEALARHPDVDMVTFTGSTRAGVRVSELASGTVKRVTLELGGKSPNLLLDDADLPTAVSDGLADAFYNAGQSCSALTRMLVPRARLADVEQLVLEAVEDWPVVDPFDVTRTRGIGPVVSRTQYDRVRAAIRRGSDEGARLLVGGEERPAGFPVGYYVQPTVFSDVDNGMSIAREEIFGPVLSLLPHDGDDDAVRIANDTVYGLAGAVWSADPDRAERVARRLRVGMVRINGGGFGTGVPFGGYRRSGNGRENGLLGFEEFLEVKALLHPAKR
jgi:aldehyde dehydrogenase (NAD+)